MITHCRGRTWRRSCRGRSRDWRLRTRRWSRSPSGTRWRPGSRSCRAPRGSGRRTPATGHRSFLIGIVTIQILNKAFLQHPKAFLDAWQIQTSFKFICFYFFVTFAIKWTPSRTWTCTWRALKQKCHFFQWHWSEVEMNQTWDGEIWIYTETEMKKVWQRWSEVCAATLPLQQRHLCVYNFSHGRGTALKQNISISFFFK